MLVPEPIDVRQLLHDEEPLDASQFKKLQQAILNPRQAATSRQEIASLTSELDSTSKSSSAALLRAGIGNYLLGRHDVAERLLSKVGEEGQALFFRGEALMSLERLGEAETCFAESARMGYEPAESTLRQAGTIRAQGRLDEAEKLVRSVAKVAAGRAEYSYQMGCILSDRGDTYGAVEYFERAIDIQPTHSQALFRLASENSLRGNDEEAIRYYEMSLSVPPFHLGALINLGLLYEDRENYNAAAFCFRRVLEAAPTHARARLYLKDIEATGNMYYDEETLREETKLQQVLSKSVGEFELSVRSRNCLAAMNLSTLGDLTRVTEQELLDGKNFGETSLQEIRDLMSQHGLVIGHYVRTRGRDSVAPSPLPPAQFSPQEQAQLSKLVSELELSVRARKCMSRLGLVTVGDLVQRSADELLSGRNFGVTSLNEIRQKLQEFGLKLRND